MVEMAWLAAGGFLGAVARHAVQSFISAHWSTKLPLGTLIVNVTGSFLLGWVISSSIQEPAALFLGTGFMGAFTTFSTVKLENIKLFKLGERKTAILYIGLTYLLGIGSAWIGFLVGT